MRAVGAWSATLLLAIALGCGGSTEQTLVAPDSGSRCQATLTTPPPLPAAGAQLDAPLSIARECAWSAQTSAEWLRVAPASGQGDATLSITATENPQGRIRSAGIDINNQRFTINQEPQPCRFEVAPRTVAVSHEGGRLQVRLTTLDGCSWTTQSSQPWLRVISGSGGDASATLELAADSNSGTERSAVLTIASMLVVVNQAAGPDDRTECRYSIDPGARTLPAAGGTASFQISTMPRCAWGALSSQPWIIVTSTANGMGTADVHYRVDANPSASTRSGIVSVGTRRHVVTQQGAADSR